LKPNNCKKFKPAPPVYALIPAALVVFFLLSSSSGARELTAVEILQRAVKETGCHLEWKTRIEEGTFIAWNTPGWGTLRANYTRIVKKPDRIKIDQDYSAYDHPFFRTFYYLDGDAWVVTNLVPRRSERTKQLMEDFLKKADWLAYYLDASKEIFSMDAPADDSLIAGKSLYRVCCATEEDSTILDIDRISFLPLRQIDSHGQRHRIFDDYKNVQGRNLPFRIIIFENGKKTQEMIWDSIEFDKTVSDSIFSENRPPEQ